MKHKLLHTFLFCASMLLATHGFAMGKETAVSIATDTVVTDSSKIKKVTANYLTALQQRVGHSTLLNTNIKPAVSSEKVYRAFPEIDKQLAENKNFNFSFADPIKITGITSPIIPLQRG